MARCVLLASFLLLISRMAAATAPLILLTDLHVTQALIAQEHAYAASPHVIISFTLHTKTDVTVTIRRHLPGPRQFQGAYLADPVLVRTLKLGKLTAGPHQATWDGLDAQQRPITYTINVPNAELRALPTPPTATQLTKQLPVNLFQISIQAGQQTCWCNFERATGLLDASRRCPPFMGAVRDTAGHAVVAARLVWRGRKYSPAWGQETVYPSTSNGHSSDPVETYDAAVDSKGNVYMATVNGIYRFTADGTPMDWTANEDYINYPYPSLSRNVLGVRLDPNAKGKKEYVFGPGGGGARKSWDTAEIIDKPGFGYSWAGLAIDRQDNLYFGCLGKTTTIQVFAPTGKYLRSLALPGGMTPRALRCASDGALWVCGDGKLARLHPETGAIEKMLDVDGSALHIGPNGTIYVYSQHSITRFTAAGTPLAFNHALPTVREPGNVLAPLVRDNHVPEGAAGYPSQIMGLATDADGGFYLSEWPTAWDDSPTRLLHYSADGHFLPDLVDVQLGQHQPGHIFLDATPATVELFLTNLSPRDARLTLTWTLTDFDNVTQTGDDEVTAAAAMHQVLPFTLPLDATGHYTLKLTVRQGQQVIGTYHAQLARIPSRQIVANRFSPFAMVWGCDFPLMAYAGVKSERGDTASWSTKVEPVPGVFYADPSDAVTYMESNEGFRQYARRWGHYLLNGLDYGEGWLVGDFPACRLFAYDNFFRYCQGVLGRFAGKSEAFYQFWNEPNFFWHVPGSFSREHFDLVNRVVWSICKARDKDALAMPDGDAGGLGIMRELAQHAGNGYTDTVIMHYPGSMPITYDKMPIPNQPEGKVPAMRDLLTLRDAAYPGKPVWNTEEGWWNAEIKSPMIGAQVIPRIYLPQLALGVDKIYWFASSSGDDPSFLLDGEIQPNPAYVSYATMTRLLEGAGYAGQYPLGEGAYAYLFIRGADAVLALWNVRGEKVIKLPVGERSITVVDLMGRSHPLVTDGGSATMILSPTVQYLCLPVNAWVRGIAHDELARQLAALKLQRASDIPGMVRKTANAAGNDDAALTRLYYLVHAAEQAVYAGAAPRHSGVAAHLAQAAHTAIVKREGADGYLRRARTMLWWTERLAALPPTDGITWATAQAADAVTSITRVETPCYPGMTLNAYIGEPGEITRIRAITPKIADYSTTIDEKFRFQLERVPGDTIELELTVWNFYRHPIHGSLLPRLPAGWQATPASSDYTLAPGEFRRRLFSVTIPSTATPGRYTLGATSSYLGQPVQEIYTQRVVIK